MEIGWVKNKGKGKGKGKEKENEKGKTKGKSKDRKMSKTRQGSRAGVKTRKVVPHKLPTVGMERETGAPRFKVEQPRPRLAQAVRRNREENGRGRQRNRAH